MSNGSLSDTAREVERLANEASYRRLDVAFARASLRERANRLRQKAHGPRVLLGAFFAGFSFGRLTTTRVGRNVAQLPGGILSIAVLGSRLYSAFHKGQARASKGG